MSSSATPAPEVRHRSPPDAWIHYWLLAIALALVVATAVTSLRGTDLLRESIDIVGHTQRVLRALIECEAALAEQESAIRSYLEAPSLEGAAKFRAADERLLNQTNLLGSLVSDNPEQRVSTRQLAETAAARSQLSRRIAGIDPGDAQRSNAGRSDELRNSGLSSSFRATVLTMRGLENRLLEARRTTMLAQLDSTRGTIIVAGGLAAVSGVLGLWMLRRSRIAWQRQLVAELEASRARRQNEEKSMFLANISHEIRTPMNAIFGFSQLLGDVATGERERQYARSITSAGRALLSLVNDILDLTKMEAGKLEIDRVPADPRELVEGTLTLFTQLAAAKGLSLRADLAADVPRQLRMDPVRVRQVLTNLVGNAVKYTDSGGVLVRMWCAAATTPWPAMSLHLAVEDSGIGIAADQLERIFQPFVQTGGAGPRREGSGLGLSISRRLVDLMGGRIRVASEPGQGSVFEVVLPFDAEARSEASVNAPPAALRPDALPPLKVLIVDDVALNRELMAAIFDGSHHTVFEAGNGADAIASVRRDRPDVVLMDMRMPVMDGLTARAHIRDDPMLDAVRLIAVTASSLGDDDRALRASFDGYVRKPYTREEIVVEIARVMSVPIAPAVAAPAPIDRAAAPSVPVQSARVAFAPQVADALAQMAGARWTELTRSLAMRDIGAFADEVAALASFDTLPALHTWATRLREAVQLFDVVAAESMLGRFPTHLRESGIAPATEQRAP
jgi:signal transduction histidine kinase/CheY-like chemotaxis protein